MARPEIRELYRALRACEFGFVPRGEHHLTDVYDSVSRQFGTLCDDAFLCSDNCSRGHDQPEWRHTTRKALWSLKANGGSIRAGHARGFWEFR